MRYGTVLSGHFVERPNRFIALVDTAGGRQVCHVGHFDVILHTVGHDLSGIIHMHIVLHERPDRSARLSGRPHPPGKLLGIPQGICKGRSATRHHHSHHRSPRDRQRYGHRRHRIHAICFNRNTDRYARNSDCFWEGLLNFASSPCFPCKTSFHKIRFVLY